MYVFVNDITYMFVVKIHMFFVLKLDITFESFLLDVFPIFFEFGITFFMTL